jgi:hypothetical protein
MGRGVFRFRVVGDEALVDDISEHPPAVAALELLRQEPTMSDRDEVIFLLHTAAEIEHALLAEYLYAAYSLKRQGRQAAWRRMLLTIAREEMAHLLSVQNLLRALGGPLNFEREDYPFNVFYPFPFELEPLTLRSVARYVLAEMPDPETIPPELGFNLPQVKLDAGVTEPGQMVNRVGALFALLLKLVEKLVDAPGDATQQPDFRPETVKLQAQPDEEWTRGEMILELVANKSDARGLVDRIGRQGEGPGEPGGAAQSHFRKFFRIYSEMKADATDTEPLAVPTNPTTRKPAPGEDDPNYISNDLSRAWADLFNSRYRLLLADLAHLLTLPIGDTAEPESRVQLFGWIFDEMRDHMGAVAEILATSPRHDPPQFKDAAQTILIAAGPPFDLPYTLQLSDQRLDRWRHREQLLAEAALRIAAVRKYAGAHDLLDTMSVGDEEKLRFVREQIRKLSEAGGNA